MDSELCCVLVEFNSLDGGKWKKTFRHVSIARPKYTTADENSTASIVKYPLTLAIHVRVHCPQIAQCSNYCCIFSIRVKIEIDPSSKSIPLSQLFNLIKCSKRSPQEQFQFSDEYCIALVRACESDFKSKLYTNIRPT